MLDKQQTYIDRIITNPRVLVGKPVVKGTRIPVEKVVAHLANNPDMADLLAAYPELTVADGKACLQHANRPIRGGEL